MNDPGRGRLAVRVERGQASDEELTALTIVLLALRAGREPADQDENKAPHGGLRWWHRPDAYKAPQSWR
ncbi:acyl-CoA carboxylase subunit epsilon [Streptomyces cavernae]|uniref:acyl-CoA carboxylase subunit epsilon n=1 Tax=Streptomyces cavernae TaxID=2259034 RepID=UPI000FEC1AA6|nr:acyl-CoA carboxylase subunit epsilon [Streptomyces cavernae]